MRTYFLRDNDLTAEELLSEYRWRATGGLLPAHVRRRQRREMWLRRLAWSLCILAIGLITYGILQWMS